MSDQAGQGPGQPSAALVTDPADQKYCCSFFWIVLQSREEDINISPTSCVWSLSVMALCVWWMGWEDEGLLTIDGVWVSQPRPHWACHSWVQAKVWRTTFYSCLFLVIKVDIDIKKMYYFLLSAKEASEGTVTYFISRTREPEMNYCLAVTLTRRAKVLLTVVILHILFLTLNLYVFTKMAEDFDISLYGRKRKY